MVKNIAIIPARSGSKRVTDKNIHPFCGKPLMAWGIEAALQSGIFDKVMVSTDSELYADIAQQYGAWVPFLREKHSDDFSTVGDVICHTIDRLRTEMALEFDHVAALQATCPLVTPHLIREVYEDFVQQGVARMGTCSKFAFMNPWWAFEMKDGAAHFVLSSPAQSRSQDNPTLYCPTGVITFSQVARLQSPDTKYHEIDWKCAVDIDTYEDIEFASALFAWINHNKKQEA